MLVDVDTPTHTATGVVEMDSLSPHQRKIDDFFPRLLRPQSSPRPISTFKEAARGPSAVQAVLQDFFPPTRAHEHDALRHEVTNAAITLGVPGDNVDVAGSNNAPNSRISGPQQVLGGEHVSDISFDQNRGEEHEDNRSTCNAREDQSAAENVVTHDSDDDEQVTDDDCEDERPLARASK
ncbi:hypothetical protein H0H81_010432, partial [Sphagnurus paluster]